MGVGWGWEVAQGPRGGPCVAPMHPSGSWDTRGYSKMTADLCPVPTLPQVLGHPFSRRFSFSLQADTLV